MPVRATLCGVIVLPLGSLTTFPSTCNCGRPEVDVAPAVFEQPPGFAPPTPGAPPVALAPPVFAAIPPVAAMPPLLMAPPVAIAPPVDIEPPMSGAPVLTPTPPAPDPPVDSVPPTPEVPLALLLEQATATAAPKSKTPTFDLEARIVRFNIHPVLPVELPAPMISQKSHSESQGNVELIFNIPVRRKTPIPLTLPRANFSSAGKRLHSANANHEVGQTRLGDILPTQIIVMTARKSEVPCVGQYPSLSIAMYPLLLSIAR